MVRVPGADGQALAERALLGVGDAAAGEWRQQGGAFHIRRRLSAAEVALSGLSMRDLRGTVEGTDRLRKLFQQVPAIKGWAVKIGEWY